MVSTQTLDYDHRNQKRVRWASSQLNPITPPDAALPPPATDSGFPPMGTLGPPPRIHSYHAPMTQQGVAPSCV